MALRILQKFKSDFPSELAHSCHITVFSSYCPESRPDLKTVFEAISEERILVDFVLGQMGQVLEEEHFNNSSEMFSLRTDVSDFAKLCMYVLYFSQILGSTFVDFSLVLSPVEKAGFSLYFCKIIQHMIRERRKVDYLTIKFPNSDTVLTCSIEELFFYHFTMHLTMVPSARAS